MVIDKVSHNEQKELLSYPEKAKVNSKKNLMVELALFFVALVLYESGF